MFSHSRAKELLSSNFNANGTLGQHTVQKNIILLATTIAQNIIFLDNHASTNPMFPHTIPLTKYFFVSHILAAGHTTLLVGSYFTFKIYRHLIQIVLSLLAIV